MQKRLKRPSPAMVVAMAALFVGLGGVGYAATLAKNSVSAKQIAKNAVRGAEIKNGAVASADVADSSLGGVDVGQGSLTGGDVEDGSLNSEDVGDESLTGGDVLDGSLGSGDITDESLTGADILDESIGSAEISGLTASDYASGQLPPPSAFARVDKNAGRTLEPNDVGQAPQNQGLAQADVVAGEGGAAIGTTCFNLPSRPASALVTLDNADAGVADRNLVASVAIDRGEDLGECPATHNDARVRIVDAATEAAQDARFFIWLLR